MHQWKEHPSYQGSLQLGRHGGPPNHFEIPPNQKVTKFICFLYVIIRRMWLAPTVIFSNQVENKILAVITKPSKMLERTLPYLTTKHIDQYYNTKHALNHILMLSTLKDQVASWVILGWQMLVVIKHIIMAWEEIHWTWHFHHKTGFYCQYIAV